MPAIEQVSALDRSQESKRRMGVLCLNLDAGSKTGLDEMVVHTPGAYVLDNLDLNVGPREVSKMLEPFQHKICLIDLDHGKEEGFRTCQRLRDGCEGVVIFAASSDFAPTEVVVAMRAGCSEYLVKPFQPEEVSAALSRLEQRRHIRGDGAVKGRLVTMMGAKGGTGVTSLAIHLALNLVQRHQKKCLIVDQHPAMGDVSLYLGLPRHRYSFYELVHNTDRLDRDLLDGFLLKHASGLEVLDSPETIDAVQSNSPEAIEHTLAFLGDSFDFVFVDCPPGLTEDTCAAIRQSDQLAIIMTAELPAIRNAVRSIEYLTGLHYPEESIEVILNRHSKREALSDDEIETALHRSIAVKIPNDYSQVVNAINCGNPIRFDRKSDLPVAFHYWANRLSGDASAGTTSVSKRRKWFGLFSA